MVKSRLTHFLGLTLVLLLASFSHGQTTQPATTRIALWRGFMIDIPANWSQTPQPMLSSAYSNRGGSLLTAAFHLTGSRPTDLPYATIEHLSYARGVTRPSTTQQLEMAQLVADYYATAFNPPSKADRPPSFKKATVTPVVFDAMNGRFTFSVVVKYDMMPDVHVEVSGAFGPQFYAISAIWSDDAYYDANRASILAMRDSLRTGIPASPTQKVSVVMKRTAQIVGILVVLALVAIQAWVLLRARRQRKADEARLLSYIGPE